MLFGQKLRYYPTESQAKIFAGWIGCQRLIYNAKVSEDRYFLAFKRKFVGAAGMLVPMDQEYSRFISADTAFLKDVPSQILRNGAYRWRNGYARFFKGLGGRPAKKKKHGRQSVMLTSELFEIRDGKLWIGTKTRPVGMLDVPLLDFGNFEPPKSIYLSVDAGRWHVSFSLEDGCEAFSEVEIAAWLRDMPDLLDKTDGFDLGVEVPVATSKGDLFGFSREQKKSLKKSERKKRRGQRIAARRQKGSNRRKMALAISAKAARKQADIRRDFAHKTSRKIVDQPDVLLIGVDGIKIKNMTKSAKGTVEKPGKNVRQKAGLARSILASAWGLTRTFVKYKALKEHKLAIEVAPAYGSQECSQCGCTIPDNRPSRDRFVCTSCQFVCHADVNAAMVAKKRAVVAILSDAWKPKERKKVSIRRAGSVRTDGANAIDARGDVVRRKGRKANAQASRNRETPTTAAIAV